MTRDEILNEIHKLVIEYNKRDINLSKFADELEKIFKTDNHSEHSKEAKQESENDEPESIIHLEGYKRNYKVKLKGYFSEITWQEIH